MISELLERAWSSEPPPAWSLLLAPLSAVWGAGAALHASAYGRGWLQVYRAEVPVISVGGLEVGGVGKTPFALELARLAVEAGLRAAILSRGFRSKARSTSAPVRIPAPIPKGAAALHGDEPAWLASMAAREIPGCAVWVCPRRGEAARHATREGARLLILDDGFQHHAMARSADVVLLAAEAPFGNGRLLPRGPLREPPSALRRADRLVSLLPAGSPGPPRALLDAACPSHPALTSIRADVRLRMERGEAPGPGDEVEILAGIAHPERLKPVVEGLGYPRSRFHRFPDHHRFSAAEIAALPGKGAVVTTEKDWMRLADLDLPRRPWAVLEQRLRWEDAAERQEWIRWIAGLARP